MKLIKILNIPITAVKLSEIYDSVDSYVQSNAKQKVIGYSNLHGLYIATNNQEIRTFYQQAVINYIDGLPLVWIANFTGFKIESDTRITFLDVAINFLEHCQNRNYKVLWLGGTEESIKIGIENIKTKIPEIDIFGIDGYKSDEEYLKVIDQRKPNIIILGQGMPRQEQWVLRNKTKIDVNVIWCVGATIDYISGKVYSPPRWSGTAGLEWFFRFMSEPRRMFPRYFLEPFVILYYLITKKKLK